MGGFFDDRIRDSLAVVGLGLTLFQTWVAVRQFRGSAARLAPKPPRSTAPRRETPPEPAPRSRGRASLIDKEGGYVFLTCGTIAIAIISLPVIFFVLAARGDILQNRDSLELGTYSILAGLTVIIVLIFFLYVGAMDRAASRWTKISLLAGAHSVVASVIIAATWGLLWSGRQSPRTLVVELVDVFGYLVIVFAASVPVLFFLRWIKNRLRWF